MEQQRQMEEERAQLDGVLEIMHNKHGEFDNDWVIARLAAHGNPDKAVEEWNQMLRQYTQQTQRQAPKVMGGHGGVPNEQVDTSKLKGQERRQAVQAILEGMSAD
jgi:hypothetical protein